jgi:hypothetical protein
MRVPRRISPGARARRALLVDTLLALALALVLLQLAAGLGVVAAIAVPALLAGLVWIGVERLVVRARHRRYKQARA